MTSLKLGAFSDDIARRYRNGDSATNIAKAYKVSTTTVTNFLRKIGLMEYIPRGYVSNKIKEAQKESIKLFKEGVRPSEIIKTTGISKTVFYDLAKKEGLDLRGLDGWTMSKEQLTKCAKTKEFTGLLNKTEKFVFDSLESAGFSVTPQAFIDGKNADLAIHSHSIAIEVCCRGTFRKYINDGSLSKRIKQFGESGWHVYVLVSHGFDSTVANGIDDMLAWVDFTKRSPTFLREHRVVRSPFDLLATGKIDCDNLSAIVDSI